MSGAQSGLTIEELAQETGLTTRNIRAYQSRGLIPAPIRRGRTGYYDSEHVERLALVRELREQGLALDLIQRMLDAGGGAQDGLRFARTVLAQSGDTDNEVLTLVELSQRWQSTDVAVLERAEALGIVRRLEDGNVEVVDARLSEVGQALLELDIAVDDALEMLADVRAVMDQIAERIMRVADERLWQPFEDAGMPPELWNKLTSDVERFGPLADQAVLGVFRLAFESVLNSSLQSKLEQLEQQRSQGS